MSLLFIEIFHKICRIFSFHSISSQNFFHSFLLFYPTITVLLTRSKLWTKRRSCSTIVQVIHTAPQSMFIFIDLHADSNHYWCISGRIKAFAYAFYYWNFQYSFPMHYLTWNRLSCSFGNIEERRGQRKLYKTVHDTKLFEITTQKKKTSLFFFLFLISMVPYNNTPEKEFV